MQHFSNLSTIIGSQKITKGQQCSVLCDSLSLERYLSTSASSSSSSSSTSSFRLTVPPSSSNNDDNSNDDNDREIINGTATTFSSDESNKDREERLKKLLLSSSPIKEEEIDKDTLAKELRLVTSSLASSESYIDIVQWMYCIIDFVERQETRSEDYEEIIPYGTAIHSLLEPISSSLSTTAIETTSPKIGLKNDSKYNEIYNLGKADELMVRMLSQQKQQQPTEWNNNIEYLYRRLIVSWSQFSHNKLIQLHNGHKTSTEERAEYWLQQWLNYMTATKTGQEKLHRDSKSSSILLLFGTTIDAYAKSKNVKGATKAEHLLKQFIELRDKYPDIPQANAVMYTSVIDAWSRRSNVIGHEASTKAEEWLREMERDYFENGNYMAKPSIVAYTSAIMAYSRRRSGSTSKHHDGSDIRKEEDDDNPARLAEGILLRLLHHNQEKIMMKKDDVEGGNDKDSMVCPDIYVYNAIMDAWARRVGIHHNNNNSRYGGGGQIQNNDNDLTIQKDMVAATRAEQWLLFLLQSNAADSTMGNSDENLTRGFLDMSSSSMTPLDTILNDNNLTFPQSDNDDDVASSNNPIPSSTTSLITSGIIPDVVSYNTVINAYSRVQQSVEAAQRAEHWLRFMINVAKIKPTSISYGSVLKAWGNTHTSIGADKANEWLESYEDAARRGEIEPSVFAYNIALNAWAWSGRDDVLDGMCQVVHRMEKCWNDDNDHEKFILPTNQAETITTALVPPDIVSYNTLIKACTAFAKKRESNNSEERSKKAFSIFLQKLDLITGADTDRKMQLDGATYHTILICLQACVPPNERSDPRYIRLCQKIMNRCKQGGWVDERVLKSLRTILDPDVFHDIITQDLSSADKERGERMNYRDLNGVVIQKWGWNARPRATGRTHGAATKRGAERSRQMKRSSR